MSITYVGIRVTDLERSLRFYREGLGLRERGRGTMGHGGTFVGLEDPTSHFQLELNHYPAGSAYAKPYVVGEGLDHLGLDVADARGLIERLRSMGAKVAVEPWLEAGRYWIGFVEDPDGIWIEIQSPAAPTGPSGPS
jgi:lactoylglutathione lyase